MPAAFLVCLPLVALAATSGPARSGGVPDSGRFVRHTVRVGGVPHDYAAWLPPGHSAHGDWPAILFLHGSGECGTDNRRQTDVGLGPALQAHPERWPFVVVFPQKPLEDEDWEEREDLVFAVLADAVRREGIDRGRVALAGMSQGGHGAWTIGARHPERWRCLVPVCGYGRALNVQRRAMRLPVWAFHGLRDDVVNPDDTRRIVAGLREQRRLNGLDPDEVRMTLFPEANHDSWDPAFASDSLTTWLVERLAKPRTP